MRTLTAIASVLLVAGCGSGAPAQSGQPAQASAAASPTPQSVALTETEFKIEPATLSLKSGSYVFTVTSQGKFPHDLHIAPQGTTAEIGAVPIIKPGDPSQSLTVDLKAGVYTYWCGVGRHRANGMEGTLTVT
jgi:plastocyanin